MPRRQEIGRKKFDRDVQTIRTKFPQWVWLQTPLDSTDWNGDSYSTTAKTVIDLSAVFAVPAGVRAIDVSVFIRDSGSGAAAAHLILSPNDTANSGKYFSCGGIANDIYARPSCIVPCDANGDVYYQVLATGATTADIWIQIWGYAI